MTDILKELAAKGKMAAVYTNWDNTSRFIFGTIIAVSDSQFAIHLVRLARAEHRTP